MLPLTDLTSAAGITAAQLPGFFQGWPNPPSPETHLRLLQQSDYVVLTGAAGATAPLTYDLLTGGDHSIAIVAPGVGPVATTP